MNPISSLNRYSHTVLPAVKPGQKQAPGNAFSHNVSLPLMKGGLSAAMLQPYMGVRFGNTPDLTEPASEAKETDTSADSILQALQQATQAKFEKTKSVMSLREFLKLVYEDPYKYLPTASSYVVNALESFGSKNQNVLGENIPVYNFTKTSWRPALQKDKVGIVSQEHTIHTFMQALRGFVDKGASNRIIIFVGPKGSGKSEIFRVIFDAVEHYSRQSEGARYTISWVFGNKKDGLRPMRTLMGDEEFQKWQEKLSANTESDMIPPEKVGAQLPSNLNIHPLFVLPMEARIKLLEDLKAKGKIKESDNFDYFIKGKLDNYSQTILDGLLKLYKGDTQKAFRHIMVERWEMSRQSGKGLAAIPPSQNRDAILRPETPDVDWAKLPGFLRSIGLLKEEGYLPNANGGLVNFDDMGREDAGRYLYLLVTGETGEAVIEGPGASTVREQLDVIFVASANPDSIYNMLRQGQWAALADRLTIIPVPHIRQYKSETELYKSYIAREQEKGRVVTPNVEDAFSLWMTMTRLLPINPKHEEYQKLNDSDFLSGLSKLDPLRKALLYQGEDINDYESGDKKRFSSKEQERLRRNLALIAKEHNYDAGKTEFSFYEGGHGLSARDGMNLMEKIIASSDPNGPLSVLDVFETLYNETKAELPYFASIQGMAGKQQLPFGVETSKGSGAGNTAIRTPRNLLLMTEAHVRRKLQNDIKHALGVYRPQEAYIKQLNKYIVHAMAFTTNTTISDVSKRSPLSSSAHPDPQMMKDMEGIISEKSLSSEDERSQFRSSISGKLSKWDKSLSDEENIGQIFGPQIQRMMAHDESHIKETLKQLTKDLMDLWQNPNVFDNDTNRKDDLPKLKKALDAIESLGYPKEIIPQILDWAFHTDHISDGSYKRKRSQIG